MKQINHYQSLEANRVRVLARKWRSNNKSLRVLDFGCGKGKYLELFRDEGCETMGVDINQGYIEELRNRGFNVSIPEDALKGHGRFDVVFLSHVIEHIHQDELVPLIQKLIALLDNSGLLVVVTPVLGERFYYDFSHIRPYYPQSIRHAFGQTGAPISYGNLDRIELTDIYFFRDPWRTRKWRTFYVGTGLKRLLVDWLNTLFDTLWRVSGGRLGVYASWLGVYRIKHEPGSAASSNSDVHRLDAAAPAIRERA